MRVVHADEALLIVLKPAGAQVARAPGERRDTRNPTIFELARKWADKKAREERVSPTRYRIAFQPDTMAGGLVVFASERYANNIIDQFHTGEGERIGYALIRGVLPSEADTGETAPNAKAPQTAGTIRTDLVLDRSGIRAATSKERPDADRREAVTHYRLVRREGDLALVKLRLETDRKGQARAHLASVGCELVTDRPPAPPGPRARKAGPPPRLALYICEVALLHPITNTKERYRASPPPAFERMLDEQRDSAAKPARMTPPQSLEPTETQSPANPKSPPERTAAPQPSSPQQPQRLTPPPALTPREPVNIRDLSPKKDRTKVSPADNTSDAPSNPQPQSDPAPTTPAPQPNAPAQSAHAEPSWEHVAGWYDAHLGSEGSDHHRDVVIPGAMRLIDPRPGQLILDIACGQGVLSRALATAGAKVLAIDASRSLLDAARAHEPPGHPAARLVRYELGDARELPAICARAGVSGFDAGACILAAMNIDPIEPMLTGAASMLRAGGSLTLVILHPAFRIPKRSDWIWEDDAGRPLQTRRIESYMSPQRIPITMNPGAAASGAKPELTWTHHRPLSTYAGAIAAAGLRIDAIEEWTSRRTSQPGPRAEAENRARAEIPMFMAIRAIKGD